VKVSGLEALIDYYDVGEMWRKTVWRTNDIGRVGGSLGKHGAETAQHVSEHS